VNPTILEALTELKRAEAECGTLIGEVEAYNWDSGPYPLGLALPYPSTDIDFFHVRARDAEDLKQRILAVLERLGSSANRWSQQIRTIDFFEVYLADPLAFGAKRPRSSGLLAAREILRTVQTALAPNVSKHAQTNIDCILPESEPKEMQPKRLPAPSVRQPPGPRPRNNDQIKQIANEYNPWRSHLPEICWLLDELRIPISEQMQQHLKATNPDWTDALDENAQAVIESIKYSIGYCKKRQSGKI
jgi:hypothetical protein